MPGLAVRATPGAKAYIFQGSFQCATIRMTIGAIDVWPLTSRMDRVGPGPRGKVSQLGAREKARQLQAVIDSGRDPREVRAEATAADVAKRRADQLQSVTVGEAWAEYLGDRKPHWGNRHLLDHQALAHKGGADWKRGKGKTIPGPLAIFMGEPLKSLTADRLERWAAKEAASRPARGRLALRLVKAFLKWCSTHKVYPTAAIPDAAVGRRIREKLGNPAKKDIVIQREQLRAWFHAVRQIPNPVISAYLQFMLLVGPRPNEPMSVKWTDVDFQWRTVTIRDKIEGTRQIGLTPYVAHLLGNLPRRNEWVFSSPRSKGGRLVEPGGPHDKACRAAGMPKMTLQAPRGSFASLSEWVGTPAGIAAQIQGHAPQGVREQNYIRRPIPRAQLYIESYYSGGII